MSEPNLRVEVKTYYHDKRTRLAELVSDNGGPTVFLWDAGPMAREDDIFDAEVDRLCEMTGAVRVDLP